MKKENGFGVVGILAVVAAIGLTSAVGWLVYDRQRTTELKEAKNTQLDKRQENTKSEKDTDPYEGWAVYSKNSLEFKYPADWKLDEQSVLRLTSNDFSSTGLQKETVTSGMLVLVGQSDIPQPNITPDNYDQSSFYGTENSNFKVVTIGDNRVAQYTVGEAGENTTLNTVFFKKDGTRIDVSTQYASNNKEASLKTYNLILESVVVN